LEDSFYTKSGKFQIANCLQQRFAIANPKSPNDQFSLCDSLGCGMWDLETKIIDLDGLM